MKICRRLLPITALAFCAITTTVWVVTLPALAQQQEYDPMLKATERLLLEAQTGYRNSVAQADVYLRQFNGDEARLSTQQKQIDGLNKEIADLQKQVTDAKNATSIAKAVASGTEPSRAVMEPKVTTPKAAEAK